MMPNCRASIEIPRKRANCSPICRIPGLLPGTFTIPWQLAGLINLDGEKRTLRFYVRQGNEMILCPYWVIDERG
mgnify:CR=1 FL=1